MKTAILLGLLALSPLGSAAAAPDLAEVQEEHGWLGVSLRLTEGEKVDIVIDQVMPDSPARKAGLRTSD